MTPTPPPAAPRSSLAPVLGLLCTALLTIGVVFVYLSAAELNTLRAEMRSVSSKNAELARAVDLLRLEQSAEGRGVHAVIERIQWYAPKLQMANTVAIERIKEHLEDCYRAAESLGPGVFDQLVAAAAEADDAEIRKGLLTAATRSDRPRGIDLLVGVVRGLELSPSSRLRFIATDMLMELDKPRAAQALATVLRTESYTGRKINVIDPDAGPINAGIGGPGFPEYANLVGRFAASDHEDTAGILEEVLRARRHNLLTYQECVKQLGRLKQRSAVDRIQELYLTQPGQVMDQPLFRNHCLQALDDILGSEAQPFFREQLAKEQNPTVVTKLQSLVR